MAEEAAYERDFYCWTKEQSKLLKNGDYGHLDVQNLIEEIESLGRSDKRFLKSYLIVLLQHKLKLEYTPEKQGNSNSWKASVIHAQSQIQSILQDSPSLKNEVGKILEDAYFTARKLALLESNVTDISFPEKCPWTPKELFY